MPDCACVRAVNKAMMQTCLDSGCRYLIERWDDVLGARPGAREQNVERRCLGEVSDTKYGGKGSAGLHDQPSKLWKNPYTSKVSGTYFTCSSGSH